MLRQLQTKDLFDENDNLPILSPSPGPDFVVSSSSDGKAISTYKDMVWDFSSYDRFGCERLFDFKFWTKGDLSLKRAVLLNEVKWLSYLYLFKKEGGDFVLSTFRDYFALFKKMAVFCEENDFKIADIFENHRLLLEFYNESSYIATRLAPLLKYLYRTGEDVTKFRVSLEAYRELRECIATRQEGEKQTSPIPTKIYGKFLTSCRDELADFEKVMVRVMSLYSECAADVFLGRLSSTQWKRRQEESAYGESVRAGFRKLLRQRDLENYWDSKGLEPSVRGLSSCVTEVLTVAAFQIQAFTGMRAGEVNSLETGCLNEISGDQDGDIHYLIDGYTTKFNSGNPFPAKWVTSKQGAQAVRVVEYIAKAIYDARCRKSPETIDVKYLFISPVYGLHGRRNTPAIIGINELRFPMLYRRIIPLIEEVDIQELEQIDPHRSWRAEPEYAVGKLWPFRSHQLRRSLALYAQRSGLVSLPSLRRQLQHITIEMSMYYGRGAELAKDFSKNDTSHFSTEWQASKAESEFLSYVINVLPKRDSLFGTHVHWIKERLVQEDGSLLFDRAETLKKFKNGLMVYRETTLGGCVNVDGCSATPVDIFEIECLKSHCKNLVGCKGKLKRVLAAQERLVQKVVEADATSPDARQEIRALDVLRATYQEVMAS